MIYNSPPIRLTLNICGSNHIAYQLQYFGRIAGRQANFGSCVIPLDRTGDSDGILQVLGDYGEQNTLFPSLHPLDRHFERPQRDTVQTIAKPKNTQIEYCPNEAVCEFFDTVRLEQIPMPDATTSRLGMIPYVFFVN